MFTLFDEIVEDDRELGGISEWEGSERVERRFIGSFSLPFSTVFKEGRIEGTVLSPYPLPLSSPPILSRYSVHLSISLLSDHDQSMQYSTHSLHTVFK